MMTTSNEHNNAHAVPQGWELVRTPITEEMHVAAAKVLHRAPGLAGLPQRMLDAMLGATPAPAPAQGEPFGYFRAEPFGWTDCAATDEGAIALYEHPAKPAQEVGLTGYIPLLEEVASSLEDYKNDAPWGSWDRERLERLYAIIAALRAKGGK